ncbi:MAG: DUF2269 domain-containing protein [Exilibacterium sp.]
MTTSGHSHFQFSLEYLIIAFMDLYTTIKTFHIISSTILFGTGIGIAFFMFRSWFTDSIQEKLYAAENTVLADYLFTFPAVIIQPVSGIALIHMAGFDWTAYWLIATYVIYIIIGLCWLPVVWIQIQLKNMCKEAFENGTDLPERYNHLFAIWFFLGWPAFLGLVAVFYLMVAKPV